MLIIPAIDIMGGQCVRLTQGKFSTKKVYNTDPLKVAKQFEKEGAEMLHIVDLDGAKKGKMINRDLIIQIQKSINIPVQTGGGIRSIQDIETCIKSGIERVIVGTKALEDINFLKEIIQRYGTDRIVVGIDIKNGKVAINGWQRETTKDYLDFAAILKGLGVVNVVVTDIARDGTLISPNFELGKNLTDMGFKVIVAGGVSNLSDIRTLESTGVQGAIIGKAIYEKKINLRDISRPRRRNIPADKGARGFASSGNPSTLTKRIIPCMDIANGRTVKGVNFKNLKDAGDPVKLGKFYSDQGADELIFLDITATIENRPTFYKLVRRIAENINIPFTVGGGIRTLDDINALLKNGADKVSICSIAVQNPEFIRQASQKFGNQCIVVSVDAKRVNNRWEVFIKGGRENTKNDAVKFAKQMEEIGAGELLINSLDRDGTKTGYDIDLLRAIAENVNLPIIASSGAGKKEDFLEAFIKGKVDAALAASLFHYGELSIPDLKNYLISNNIQIRP
ncbi:imidazole glycerol phosphate synthase subunit HisF [Patescibacteria group bacterium]|nr:imidazole glycerol phosphate synthase subunit HisF [Patescibacteria group bacterium]MBU1683712.1 imidazole glycerol phosphate synthase subunit HisF [Patescibacteria group bacterium]MBU1934509.1 imidazole glycerol phosphate synthase subunit HisF [Patescibacteria group bacterium]